MTVLYVVLGVLLAVFLLLWIPIRLSLDFEGELSVRLRYLFLSFSLYPQKEEKRKKADQLERRHKPKKKSDTKEGRSALLSFGEMLKEDGLGAVVSYLSEMVRITTTAAKKLLQALVVDRLGLQIQVVGEDAADTAILFGKVCAGVYPSLSLLQGVIRTKRRQVEIVPDFSGEKTQVRFHIRLHVLPVRLLAVAVGFILRYLAYTMKNEDKEIQSTQEV